MVMPAKISTLSHILWDHTEARRAAQTGNAAVACLLTATMALLAGCELEPPTRPVHPYRVARTEPPPAPAPETPVPNTQVYVYPVKGQTPEQLDRDRYECHAWAVKQSNFDPSEVRVAPHQRVRVVAMPPPQSDVPAGAATGAVLGAVVSRPRDAGAGAIIGAIAGAAIGAASDSSKQQQYDEIQKARDERNSQAAASASASLEQQASGYRRAIGACLEARGYTVK
jgi:outer membrane lipoprotein SlyB